MKLFLYLFSVLGNFYSGVSSPCVANLGRCGGGHFRTMRFICNVSLAPPSLVHFIDSHAVLHSHCITAMTWRTSPPRGHFSRKKILPGVSIPTPSILVGTLFRTNHPLLRLQDEAFPTTSNGGHFPCFHRLQRLSPHAKNSIVIYC